MASLPENIPGAKYVAIIIRQAHLTPKGDPSKHKMVIDFEKMLLEIECKDKVSFTAKISAYDWIHGCHDEFLDSVIKRLFEKDFELGKNVRIKFG